MLQGTSSKVLSENELNNHWEYNYRSFLNYISQALYGIRGTVTDSTTGQPLAAKVFVENHDKDSSHVYAHMPHGDFYRPILAGTYTLTVTCDKYVPRTIANVTVENDKATVLNITLWPINPVIMIPALVTPTDSATDIALEPTLTWSTVPTATSYGLQISPASDFSNLVVYQINLTDSCYTPTGHLTNNTLYYWRVNATGDTVSSVWSPAWNFTTVVTVSAPPVLISPLNDAVGVALSPVLTWNASPGAESYTVQVSGKIDFSTLVVHQVGVTATVHQAPILENNTLHFWRVSAANAGGTSDWSKVWYFMVLITAIQDMDNSGPDPEAMVFTVQPTVVKNGCMAVDFYYQSPDQKDAQLILYDALGNTVFEKEYILHPSRKAVPFGSWDLINPNGKKVSNGTYLAVLKSTDLYNSIEVLQVTFGVKDD